MSQQRSINSFFKPKNVSTTKVSADKVLKSQSSSHEISEKANKRSLDSFQERIDKRARQLDDSVHQKFVNKLIGRGYNTGEEELGTDENPDEFPEDQDSDEEQESAGPPKKLKATSKLTPFEEQFYELKEQYPDALLAVEYGYKYKFFMEDAIEASKALKSFFIHGRVSRDANDPRNKHYTKLASTTFHPANLHSNVKRLVDLGYKVGVVTQAETAALKAAGDSRYKPMKRVVSRLYTSATYVDDSQLPSARFDGGSSGFILALRQKESTFALVAAQLSTGEIHVDQFTDTKLLSELETRLRHIQPSELVVVGAIDSTTKAMISRLSVSNSFSSDEKCKPRVETVDVPKTCSTTLADLFPNDTMVLDRLLKYSQELQECFTALATHLKQFNLESIFQMVKVYEDMSSRSHMLLTANALQSLEIFNSASSGRHSHGSLFWVMDNTRSAFGQRLLRRWVLRPLYDREQLELRLDAVAEVASASAHASVEKALNLLTKAPDIEKGITSIYYGRCSRLQCYRTLKCLADISSAFISQTLPFTSPYLLRLFQALPAYQNEIHELFVQINAQAALKESNKSSPEDLKECKRNFFADDDKYEAIAREKENVAFCEMSLQKYLQEKREETGLSYLAYKQTPTANYLIEVLRKDVQRVPDNWIKMGSIKTAFRYRTSELNKLVNALELSKDTLALECDRGFKRFIQEISEHCEELRSVVSAMAQLDCIFSLAAISTAQGFVRPQFVDEPIISIQEGRNPVIDQLNGFYIPNPVELAGSGKRAVVITGPNMGGKSSYVRQVALIVIMAQVGCYVPAQRAKMGLVDSIFTRMGAYDNIIAGQSTFMLELKECSDIMKHATSRSLVILDEIGRGTSTMDGVAIAYAVLAHFVEQIKSLTLFITHYPSLTIFERLHPQHCVNCYMTFMETKSEDGDGKITFLYKFEKGVAHRSYGLNVAMLARLPNEIIMKAREKSKELEVNMVDDEKLALLKRVMEGTSNSEDEKELKRLATV